MKTSPVFRFLLVAIAAMAFIVAAACTTGQPEAPAAPAPAPAAAPAPSAPAPAPGAPSAPAPQPGLPATSPSSPPAGLPAVNLDPDQTLYFIPESVGPRLAPYRSGSQHRFWYTSAFMPMFRFNEQNELIPGYALSYDVNDNATVFTVHMDPAAMFTDGTPLTANHVKQLWEYANRPEDNTSASLSSARVDAGDIKGMEAVLNGAADTAEGLVVLDNHTIQFVMDRPNVLFPEVMAKFTYGMFKVDHAKSDPNWETSAIGVGPYTVSLFDPNTTAVELEATSNWWREPATIQKLVQLYSNDAQVRLIMFENQEVDVMFTAPTHHPAVYEPNHPLQPYLHWIPSNSYFHYQLDASSPPLDDRNVRAAIAHAIDVPRIVNAVFGASGGLAESIILPGYKCYDPEYKPLRQDVAKAQQLLAQSKYGSPANMPRVTIGLGASGVQWIRATEAIQAMLQDHLGMDINIVIVEPGQQAPADANMFRPSGGAVYDPLPLLTRYATRPGSGIPQDNPGLMQMLDEMNSATTLDDPARCDKLQAINREFMDNHYTIGFIERNYMYIVRPWVVGFKSSWNTDALDLHLMQISKRN